MNRKGKIIVSVVGIFIVLLALVGITYGYFLTRIQGNTNTTSISVTTADLKLVYDGDNGSIIGKNEVIEPNTTFTTKTFTVENKGNKTIDAYSVILEEVGITDATSGDAVELIGTRNNEKHGYKENDFDLEIKCNDGTEEKVVYTGELPEENAILVTNSIEPGEIHTYSATLKYVETNDDQSKDMNKKITGKFNIIDTKDTANLSGKVSNMGGSKYYVQTNSTKRVSFIDSEGNYTILGLEAGAHTLKLCNSTDTTCEDPVMTKQITIKTGTETNVNVNTGEITISGEYKNATININASGGTTEIINSIEFNNPYKEGTLAYTLLNNASKATGTGTILSDPLTKPAAEISGVTNYKTTGEEATSTKEMTDVSTYASGTWYYYDTYVVDRATGKFTLSGKHSCTYSSCYADLKNKYLYSTSASSNSNSNVHTDETKTNLSNIYKVTETTTTSLSYVTIYNSPDKAERVLAKSLDNYGTSYYYRGDIEDNYLNFANMCWRIVRIEGDGSIKLILEDATYECNNSSYIGDWSDGKEYSIGRDYSKTLEPFQNVLSTKISEKYKDKIIEDKLKKDEWCIDTSITLILEEDYFGQFTYQKQYYGAHTRIISDKTPSLKCENADYAPCTIALSYVGFLTADEVVFAGATGAENYNYYLMNNYSKKGSRELSFWSWSPKWYNTMRARLYYFYLSDDGGWSERENYESLYVRPAVTLKSGSVISGGEGTIDNPYIVG